MICFAALRASLAVSGVTPSILWSSIKSNGAFFHVGSKPVWIFRRVSDQTKQRHQHKVVG
jgi:hypothetical protein